MKFRSKFNHGFTNCSCLHSTTQKAYKAREMDHEFTLKILKFTLNSIEKVKPDFLLSSMGMFPESNRTKS